MAIQVPKLNDEVTRFLQKFARENSFASKAARAQFDKTWDLMPADGKVQFIAAYLNRGRLGTGKAAQAAASDIIENSFQQISDEVLSATVKRFAGRLTPEEREEMKEAVRYAASEALENAISAAAKEAGDKKESIPGPTGTRVGITYEPGRGGLVPSVMAPARAELPAEEKVTVKFSREPVIYAPEDKKEENPIRNFVSFEGRSDLEAYTKRKRDELTKLIELAKIRASSIRARNGVVKKSDSQTVTDKEGKIRWAEIVVTPPNPELADKLEGIIAEKEQAYGLRTPASLKDLPKLENQLALVQRAIDNKGIGGYAPVNPNAGLKLVPVKIKKEVLRGRGKKRGPVVIDDVEMQYVPKEIIGEKGSADSLEDSAARLRRKIDENIYIFAEEAGIDPESGWVEEVGGLIGELERDKTFQIPKDRLNDVRLLGEIRKKAVQAAKATTPSAGATRIAKGTEFQSKEEARAYRKAFKEKGALLKMEEIEDAIALKLASGKELTKAENQFNSATRDIKLHMAEKVFRALNIDSKKRVVEKVVDTYYQPFRWKTGPAGIFESAPSLQADSKAVTMLDQKPELYPMLGLGRGAVRSDTPSPTYVNVALWEAGSKLKPLQRMRQSVYMSPDWVSKVYGTEAIDRVRELKVAAAKEAARRSIADANAQARRDPSLTLAGRARLVRAAAKTASERIRNAGASAPQSITRWDLAQAGYNDPMFEMEMEAAIRAGGGELPKKTLFARALDVWDKSESSRSNLNVTFAPLLLIGRGKDKRFVEANSPEGKKFLIETNATAYMYGEKDGHSYAAAKRNEGKFLKLAEQMVEEEMAAEGFDFDPSDKESKRAFEEKFDELLPLRVQILLSDEPIPTQNHVELIRLYNARLRDPEVKPRAVMAGGPRKAVEVRASPKSNESIRAEAGEKVTKRNFERLQQVAGELPSLESIANTIESDRGVNNLRGAAQAAAKRRAAADAVQVRRSLAFQQAIRVDEESARLAERFEADVAEVELQLRRARGVLGFRRKAEDAKALRAAREEAARVEREAAEAKAARYAEEQAALREVTVDRPERFTSPIEQQIEALRIASQKPGFPKWKKQLLERLEKQAAMEIVQKKLDGLGFGFGSYDLGSKITITAVGGLLAFGLFKALTSKGNQS